MTTVANRKCLKISTRFFGHYKILKKVGMEAYKLEFLVGSKVHPVFHVSVEETSWPWCKPTHLPLMDEAGVLVKEPISISDKLISKKGGKAITKILVQWRNTFPMDATWEFFSSFQQQFPNFHP